MSDFCAVLALATACIIWALWRIESCNVLEDALREQLRLTHQAKRFWLEEMERDTVWDMHDSLERLANEVELGR